MAKYPKVIFVTGGVSSSLGKGLTSSSLASLLQSQGYSVIIKKMDGYLNSDPGTMSPLQHGEVFVTEDGVEADLDLGHYERFTDTNTGAANSTTMGKIYTSVISKERHGHFDGGTVQVIPHVTDEIKNFIMLNTEDVHFVICEIGGTVGDIENLSFLEAVRQLRLDLGLNKTMFIHLALVPFVQSAGEIKTKPAQHSVKDLLGFGIQPDILMCRSQMSLSAEVKAKLGLFCNIPHDRVISAIDVDNIYQIPLEYIHEGLDRKVCEYFGLDFIPNAPTPWRSIVHKIKNANLTTKVAIVGKYAKLPDAYKSLIESIKHGGIENNTEVEIDLIDACDHDEDGDKLCDKLSNYSGIIVPGGFGARGINAKITAIRYARENNVPFIGICWGMQLAVIEFARNVVGIHDASSIEFDEHGSHVVTFMDQWIGQTGVQKRLKTDQIGGTMRLGSYPCIIKKQSLAYRIYQQDMIHERHRHRYEIDVNYAERLEKHGMVFSGTSQDGLLPEILEIKNHKFFIATQFHPEFLSRPTRPHPLFSHLIAQAKYDLL